MNTVTVATARRPAGTAVAAAAYVASWIAGLLLAPTAPGHDAPAAAVAAFYAAHGGAVLVSALLVHGTAGLALAALAVGLARATGVRGGLRRVVVGTGLAAATLSVLQFVLAVAAVVGEHAAATARTLLLAIDFVDVLKIALLAAFTWVATTAAARAGAAPRWLRATAAVLVPLLLIGSAALAGVDALLPVLAVSLLVLLAWAAAIGVLVSRSARTAGVPHVRLSGARSHPHPHPEDAMTTATLINCFEVPAEQDERFIALWQRADDLLRRRGGYRSTRLHKALGPQARFRYVNVAELDSVETWQSVIGGPEFGAIAAQMAEFHPAPGLYTVAVAHSAAGVDPAADEP
jgi:hypothetical protein